MLPLTEVLKNERLTSQPPEMLCLSPPKPMLRHGTRHTRPLHSFAPFWHISLTSCVSKLLERIVLACLLLFLESNSIFSSRQAGFRPSRSTLDQIHFISLSPFRIGLANPSRFSDDPYHYRLFQGLLVWHTVLFHKLISTGLAPCFV